MDYIFLPWQKAFRQIPEIIMAKISLLKEEYFKVETVVKISKAKLNSGQYKHIGIDNSDKFLLFVLPKENTGRASYYNMHQRVIVKHDEPKVLKSFYWEAPNFGDPNKGWHEIYFTKMVYSRVYIEPQFLHIEIEKLQESDIEAVFKFSIDRAISKNDPNFGTELLSELNLLQENVGNSDIFPLNTPIVDYLKTITLTWEIFPKGTKDQEVNYLLGRFSPRDELEESGIIERYEVIKSLNPVEIFTGLCGMHKYFAAIIREDIVVCENLRYGNAIYILRENWADLSKKDRLTLLAYHREEIIRIFHTTNYQRYLYLEISRLKTEKK